MERITVKEAAELLGVSEQFVRIGMQRGQLPIGTAVKLKRWAYHISPYLLEQYTGKKMPPCGNRATKPLNNDSAERTR